jgi:hypothetical protein
LDLALIIGGTESLEIPLINFADYTTLHRFGPLTWNNISSHLISKYSGLANKGEEEKKDTYRRLAIAAAKYTASNSPRKGVLIFPGMWKGLGSHEALNLAQRLASSTPHNIFVALLAHPCTTAANAAELNPNFTGPSTQHVLSDRFYYDSEVGMGERTLAGDICFRFSHNIRRFLVVQARPQVDRHQDTETAFADVNIISPGSYAGPSTLETDSDVAEHVTLLTVPRTGSHPPRLPHFRNVYARLLPDLDRNWPNYHVYRLASMDESALDRMMAHYSSDVEEKRANAPTPPTAALCNPEVIVQPCRVDNDIRIIKITRLQPFSLPNHRFAPISILRKLGVAKSAVPLSNFFLKIHSQLTDEAPLTL